MKVVQLYEWTPKQFLNSTLNPKLPIRAPKSKKKKKQRLSQNLMPELKETKKIKVVALYE